MEIKPNKPFRSPKTFDETMHRAVLEIFEYLETKYNVFLLGTGMHPLLRLEETGVWPHRHRQIYREYSKIFNLKQHGWLNIQSFQLNLPYSTEEKGIALHNLLANLCAYLPAVSASSPIYEGKIGENVDNRLFFYLINQKEVPSVTGDVVPEYVSSFQHYRREIIWKYSMDLAKAGVKAPLLYKDWVNSRGVIFRFDRKALEIRVMDEQECIKSDVALSCFIRVALRWMINEAIEPLPHEILVKNFNSIIKGGLNAKVLNPNGSTARQVCLYILRKASDYATDEEKEYLSIVFERVKRGSLSEVVRKRVIEKAKKTDFKEALISVYSKLIKSLEKNEPYF
jgi:gamma-glutamyl:cysteine ligase YbdK (ATP-grasp superfamily)